MDYEIEVNFDDDTSDVGQAITYYRFLDKWGARGIGHEKTKTSTMLVTSKKPLDIEQLTEDLEEIRILSFRKVA